MNMPIHKNNRGAVLASALIILASLTMIAVTIAYRNTMDELMAGNQRDVVNAMAIADSGIDHAFSVVKNNYVSGQAFDPDLFTDNGGVVASASVSGGSYTVTATCVYHTSACTAPPVDYNETVVLTSTGTFNGASREVEIILEQLPTGGPGQYAILTDTDINAISGDPQILSLPGGGGANVHANADVIISGNPIIEGAVSAVGVVEISGNPNIQDGEVAGASTVQIPHVYPPEYRQYATVIFTWDCDVETPGGTVIADLSSGDKWHGWDCADGDKWTMGDSDPVGGLYAGFYYVEGNVVISGGPLVVWYVSIVADGYIEISGNPFFKPWGSHPFNTTGDEIADEILFIAGNDLKINGNPEQEFFGILAAHMEVGVSGNPILTGTILAENGHHQMGQEMESGQEVKNIVDQNFISGNMILWSTGNSIGSGGGKVLTVTAWRELVPAN